MIYAFTAVSAVVPSMLLLWFFHSRDTFREPGRVVWATFGFGVLAIIPVLVVAAPFAIALDAAHLPYPLVVGLVSAFITAGFPEELFKYSVLVLYAGRHQEFDEPMDGIVYGVAASLGFATLENILYTAQGGSASR